MQCATTLIMNPIHNNHTAYWVLGKGIAKEFEEEPPEEFLEQAKERGWGVYYTVNELGDVRNEKGNLRHKDNVSLLTACFADFDEGSKEEQMRRIRSFLPPSAIVESGRGYHAYWEFLCPLGPDRATLWTYAQHRIAEHLGGDPACSDPARLLRLPGSWHIKEGYEPSLVRIVERTTRRYSMEEILAEFKPPEPVRTYNRSTYRPISRVPPPEKLTEGTRHGALKRMTGKLFYGSAPIEKEERTNILKAWYISSCHPLKDIWEQEVEDMVKWVLNKEHHG